MVTAAVIRDSDFRLLTEFVRPDAKKRLALGGTLIGGHAFNIYRNASGQYVLDPVRTVPAAEAWLFANPEALAAVRQGLQESVAGKRAYRGSFAKYAGS